MVDTLDKHRNSTSTEERDREKPKMTWPHQDAHTRLPGGGNLRSFANEPLSLLQTRGAQLEGQKDNDMNKTSSSTGGASVPF